MRPSRVVTLFRRGLVLGALGGMAMAALFAYEFVRAPRMRLQPHLRTFEAPFPPLPPGTLPLSPAEPSPPPSPRAASAARGKVYYGYYCLACHGEAGDGNGPVGQSYIPVPSDLRSERIPGYGDARLLRESLEGIGHAPVLERVVPPAHRADLLAYLRALSPAARPR